MNEYIGKVKDVLTKYNVALRDSNGEYRDTYDIMQDIAAVWAALVGDEVK